MKKTNIPLPPGQPARSDIHVIHCKWGQTIAIGASQITPAKLLADCKSATPVVAANGNATDFRKSNSYVYDFYCNVLPDANAGTFVALNSFYAKDAHNVYNNTNLEDNGDDAVQTIQGADPNSFSFIPDPKNPNSINGYSVYYTKDKDHVYWDGYVIPGVNPNALKVVYPPKSCTTCIFDAQVGESNFYYRGQLMGSSISL